MSETSKRAILYARFSPRPNEAESESIEQQLEELRAWCAANGYEIAGEFSDRALSGGDDWEDRPGMLDAAQAMKRGYVFLVRAFDRLFRDTRKGLVFAHEIERRGGSVVSITQEAASLHSPEGRLMRGLLLLVAEYEREMIRARTRAAMRRHQANGRRMSNVCPYGQKRDPENGARLVDDPEEQPVIEMIREKAAEGLSLRKIAAWLNEEGVPARGEKGWTHHIIGRILKRAAR